MNELKLCPFCGWEFAEHAWNEFGEEYRVCDQCGASSGTVDSKWDWQSRPIEDALQARIAELEAENAMLKQLPQPIKFWSDEKRQIYKINERRTVKSGSEECRE